MRFIHTSLKEAMIVEMEIMSDERGYFARSWCSQEFRDGGLDNSIAQCNVSFNKSKGTLRGMHYQLEPFAETKLVRCTRGAIWDVIIDLRNASETFLKWFGIELTPDNGRMLYVPKGFAHGFLTLKDNTEVFYMMGSYYSPHHARGVRWDDPLFGIRWPAPVYVIADKDRNYSNSSQQDFFQI